MGYILATLLSYLLLYKYAALFVVIFAAGILLPLPANTVLFATGAFASQGYFDLPTSLAVALAANTLGDLGGYAITRTWRHRFIKRNYLEKVPYLAFLERYVASHPGLTIMITRFMSTPETLVNFLAGLAGVPVRQFLTFDIAGNILDICLFLGAGYVLGTITEGLSDAISLFGWMIAIGFLIVVIWGVMMRRRRAV